MNERTLIIIPTYDERENVEPMSAAVLAQAPGAELLCVDDNSPDGTGELVDAIAAHYRKEQTGKESVSPADEEP